MRLKDEIKAASKANGLRIPDHVAIIMDGNGRWAEQRGLPRLSGHKAGVENIRPVLEVLSEYGVKYVTVYAFSTENWNRPYDEVEGLMVILKEAIHRETQALHESGVRIHHLGRTDRLTPALQEAVNFAQDLTKDNDLVTLSVAFDYGGRAEILEAVKRIVRDGAPADQLNEENFGQYLYTAGLPDPDLIVRTGGELRLSNFLLWQSAYSEYFPTPTLWPDLGEADLAKAMDSFSKRQRRFGTLIQGSEEPPA